VEHLINRRACARRHEFHHRLCRPAAGVNQAFKFAAFGNGAGGTGFGWLLEATGRAACPNRFVSFAPSCTTVTTTPNGGAAHTTNALAMGAATPTGSMFRLQILGAKRPAVKQSNSKGMLCADPFAWQSTAAKAYYLACTGGKLDLYTIVNGGPINADATFSKVGVALGGSAATWAASANRWAGVAPFPMPPPGSTLSRFAGDSALNPAATREL
jgi:hypothetical protein